jgi:hypothetical protein
MILQAWLFSAKRAWQEPYVKVLTCLVFSLMLGGVSYFLWKMLPRVGVVPSFVLHTNLYLGIDNVGSWRWLFLLPTVWVSVTVLDLLLAISFAMHWGVEKIISAVRHIFFLSAAGISPVNNWRSAKSSGSCSLKDSRCCSTRGFVGACVLMTLEE